VEFKILLGGAVALSRSRPVINRFLGRHSPTRAGAGAMHSGYAHAQRQKRARQRARDRRDGISSPALVCLCGASRPDSHSSRCRLVSSHQAPLPTSAPAPCRLVLTPLGPIVSRLRSDAPAPRDVRARRRPRVVRLRRPHRALARRVVVVVVARRPRAVADVLRAPRSHRLRARHRRLRGLAAVDGPPPVPEHGPRARGRGRRRPRVRRGGRVAHQGRPPRRVAPARAEDAHRRARREPGGFDARGDHVADDARREGVPRRDVRGGDGGRDEQRIDADHGGFQRRPAATRGGVRERRDARDRAARSVARERAVPVRDDGVPGVRVLGQVRRDRARRAGADSRRREGAFVLRPTLAGFLTTAFAR
jgi:hypothetical protein